MGMAHQAPTSRYVRKYNVSNHALERFRERVDEDLKARSDHDLRNLLDEKVCQGQRQTVRDPRAPDELTDVCTLNLRTGTYYAIVRDQTVITVLDEDMVRANYQSYGTPVNTPFAKLRELKLSAATRLTSTGTQSASPVPSPAPTPVPAPPAWSQLDEAGARYARALQHVAEHEAKLAAALDVVGLAQEALAAAHKTCNEMHERLIALTVGLPDDVPASPEPDEAEADAAR